MAINESLLVAAPMLQDYLVDKDTGLPLAAGIITLFEENQRTVLKNWYTQQGTNPPYTFVPLPNPMVLSAVGTIQDTSGNDVIPFFYPYDEDQESPVVQTYFITVQDQDLELQFTRSNFPYTPTATSGNNIPDNQSLVVNGGFWRNVANDILSPTSGIDVTSLPVNVISLNGTDYNYYTLAPSQHDGFTMPDINYFKNSADAGVDFVNFRTFAGNFADDVLDGDVTPDYYLQFTSTGGTATDKYIQIPINSSIFSLSGNTNVTFKIQAINLTPGSPTSLGMGILQYLGTTVTSPLVDFQTVALNGAWTPYPVNVPIPSAQTVAESLAGDSGLYVQIKIPAGTAVSIGIACPGLFLSDIDEVPTNSFQTNDQINAIVSSPRTGDTRTSLNSFAPFGWVPANNGTIGSLNSGASTRANIDTWQLYKLIYLAVNNLYAPVTGGRTAPGNTVATAYADFTTNKPMALTKTLGRILLGMPTSATFTYTAVGGICVLSAGPVDPTMFYFGAQVMITSFTGGPPFVAGTVYFVFPNSANTGFFLANSLANAIGHSQISGGTNGSGTLNFMFGSPVGENQHTPTTFEMANHDHPGTVLDTTNSATGTKFFVPAGQVDSGINIAVTIAAQGGGAPFNVVQPSTFMNVFLKL